MMLNSGVMTSAEPSFLALRTASIIRDLEQVVISIVTSREVLDYGTCLMSFETGQQTLCPEGSTERERIGPKVSLLVAGEVKGPLVQVTRRNSNGSHLPEAQMALFVAEQGEQRIEASHLLSDSQDHSILIELILSLWL